MAIRKYHGVVTTRFDASEFGLVYVKQFGEVPFAYDNSVYATKGKKVGVAGSRSSR